MISLNLVLLSLQLFPPSLYSSMCLTLQRNTRRTAPLSWSWRGRSTAQAAQETGRQKAPFSWCVWLRTVTSPTSSYFNSEITMKLLFGIQTNYRFSKPRFICTALNRSCVSQRALQALCRLEHCRCTVWAVRTWMVLKTENTVDLSQCYWPLLCCLWQQLLKPLIPRTLK